MQSVAITTDKDNRLNFKNKLLNKVETALAPPLPSVEVEPEDVEILEQYSTWVPVGSNLESEEFFPDFKKEESYIPQHELEERATVKRGLLNKVEESLIPVEVEEPKPIEIVEKYVNWTPARLELEPQDTLLPEIKKIETSVSPWEAEKRDAIEADLLNEVVDMVPVVKPAPKPVEIIEKYSKGIPARFTTETDEPFFPEPIRGDTSSRDASFTPHSEIEKRSSFKASLLNRVEAARVSEPVVIEQAPVEIIEKYSRWAPSRLALEPQDSLLPEFQTQEPILSPYELEKKQAVLAKADQVPTIQEAVEPLVPEIIEEYSEWVPARLVIEPEDKFLPEPKKEEPFIPHRELEKRVNIKHSLSNKLNTALSPPISEVVEVPEIEIIEKFSSGIPKIDPKPMDPFFPEADRTITVPQGDISKREAFKVALSKKIDSLPVIKSTPEEIEIVGDYSQRTITSYGLDFEEAKIPALVVSELQETIVDFTPVNEEPVIPVLRLPENYIELDERALYGVLIRNSDLQHTSETANLVLDVLSGRSSQAVELVIIEAPKPKPVVKSEAVPVKKEEVFVPTEIVSAIGIKSEEPKVNVPELIKVLEPFNFDLPSDWESIPLSTLRTDLLSTGATPEQVDAKMATLVRKTESPMVEEVIAETSDIDLPEEFTSWKPFSQYLYLTNERKLTPDRANGIIWDLR